LDFPRADIDLDFLARQMERLQILGHPAQAAPRHYCLCRIIPQKTPQREIPDLLDFTGGTSA
jgi:hypothetical protein